MKKRILYFIATAIIASAAWVSCQEKPDDEEDNNDPKIQITATVSAYFDLKLEMAGKGKMTIKWGDGTATETHMLSDTLKIFKHNYKKSASYTILITGDIIRLGCSTGNITYLDVSQHPGLIDLNCSNNRLTSLDVSKNTALLYLYCSGNILTNLDVSNITTLVNLFCGGNRLAHLDVSRHRYLSSLDCSGNLLTHLDVRENGMLTSLNCSRNNITNLDLSRNSLLASLDCSINNLTNLDISRNPMLTHLDCSLNANASNSGLSSLDMSRNKMLQRLICRWNDFSDAALNALFETLHGDAFPVDNSVDIVGNPGTNLCDPSIAEYKGWKIILY